MDIVIGLDEAGITRLAEERHLVLVLPFTDLAMARRSSALIAGRAACDGLLAAVPDHDRTGFISIANRVFRMSTSALFGYVAQDAFAGREWGKRVSQAFEDPKHGLLGFNDGKWHGRLASFGVARRTWAQQNYEGDLFFPEYRAHYADVELTLLAIAQTAYVYDPNCVMIEVDYDKEGKTVDASDKALYGERRASGLGGRVHDERVLSMFS